MARYEGEEIEVIPPVLRLEKQELILIIHDEYIFYTNDEKKNLSS